MNFQKLLELAKNCNWMKFISDKWKYCFRISIFIFVFYLWFCWMYVLFSVRFTLSFQIRRQKEANKKIIIMVYFFFFCCEEQFNFLFALLGSDYGIVVTVFVSVCLLFEMCRTMSDCLSESHNHFGVIYICNWQFQFISVFFFFSHSRCASLVSVFLLLLCCLLFYS